MSDAKRLQSKGIREFQEGDFEKATATFTEALAAFEADEDVIGVAEMKVNLGLCHRSLEKYDKAIELMEAGLAVFREQEDRHREAQVLGNMALAYAKQENTEQAATLYREAAAIFKEADDDENYGQTILALADMQFKAGELMQAVATFEIGLDHIHSPNTRQKMAKQLLVVKNRLMGQKKAQEAGDGDDQPVSDRRRRRLLRRKDKEQS